MKDCDWVIQTHQLTRRYGSKTAVDGIGLQVGPGEVYAFLRENGANKTTTIRLLLGLQRPTAGEVRLFGRPLAENRTRALARVGSHIEWPSFYGHLTGEENLEVIRPLRGLRRAEIQRVLEVVGLREAAKTRVATYSQGMKQRPAIARTSRSGHSG